MVETIKVIFEFIKSMYQIPKLILKVNLPYIFKNNTPTWYIEFPTNITKNFFDNNPKYDIQYGYGRWSLRRIRRSD